MGKEIPKKGIDIWFENLYKVSNDRRKGVERRFINRRYRFERRMQLIEVSIERRTGNERRSYK